MKRFGRRCRVGHARGRSLMRELPDGLDTPAFCRAAKAFRLAGPQQRLTIARALVGSPEILVLDDSASALDFATDAALRRAIAGFWTGR